MTTRTKAHAAEATAVLATAGFWSYGRLYIAKRTSLTLSQTTAALNALADSGKVRRVHQPSGVITYRNADSYVS